MTDLLRHVDAETLARWFHEEYEARAPEHGYKTLAASAVPWPDVPEPNKSLMVEVARVMLHRLRSGYVGSEATPEGGA